MTNSPIQTHDVSPKVITRIFIDPNGNLVVTDLWEDVAKILGTSFTPETEDAHEAD